ncbi:MAG TPA: hypothetical protein VHD76_04580 [Bryobacteraceae bacterium]|jgi:hypothetical protein|nr:hypothetical protein [Bryobacteraceae bacterium]
MIKRLAGMGVLLAASALAADLGSVKAEPDPNKRSELAIENANAALDEARVASQAGDEAKLNAALREISESAEVCYGSLKASGEKPHRSKYYKRAELRLRKLLRRLSGFVDELPLEQRAPAAEAQQAVQTIHDRILTDELVKK